MTDKAVLIEFELNVIGRTREEAVQLLDDLANAMLLQVGGTPWVAYREDINKTHEPSLTISDDQGFYYKACRAYTFNGPHVGTDAIRPLHEGFDLQKRLVEE
jgi:hypothetical protein